jgi:hypothetical protein
MRRRTEAMRVGQRFKSVENTAKPAMTLALVGRRRLDGRRSRPLPTPFDRQGRCSGQICLATLRVGSGTTILGCYMVNN